MLVISHESKLYICWTFFIHIWCIFSSFYYAKVAAFKEEPGIKWWTLIYIESIFLVDCLVQFCKDYLYDNKSG